MSWGPFTDGAMRLLEKSLAWQTTNQEIMAGNIANLDTPGYTRKDLDFQNVLERYTQGYLLEVNLTTTEPGHLPGADPGAAVVQDTWEQVDLDREMVRMAENQITYNASVQMLIKKLEHLRTVIQGDSQ